MDLSNSTTYRAPIQLTTTPLGASVTTYYPSAQGQDRLGGVSLFKRLSAEAWSDVSGTLTLEESDARSSWSTAGVAVTVSANDQASYAWTTLTKRYWRWKYVNDGTAQTLFRLFEDKTSGTSALTEITGSSLTGATAMETQGNAAHDAPVVGNPIRNGARARSGTPTQVANDDATDLWASLRGTLQVGLRDNADNPVAGATGAAIPAGAVLLAASDGSLLRALGVASGIGDAANGAANLAVGLYGHDGSAWNRADMVNTGQLVTTLKNSGGFEPLASATINGDGVTGGAMLAAGGYGWQGTSWDRMRVANVRKRAGATALAAAGTATLWTPAAGKKFRIMGVILSAGATSNWIVKDGAGGTILFDVRITGTGIFHADFGQGFLSSAANNVVQLLNNGGGAADVEATLWGTEE